jgi:hypothetical protein
LLVVLSGCSSGGDGGRPHRRPAQDAAPGKTTTVDAGPARAAAPWTCAQIGTTSAAPAVSEEAEAANRRALEVHQAGRYEESERAFREVVAGSPGYAMARFNHACALARLERVTEAWAELGPLLCADLPTFAERLAKDDDLRALRDDPRTGPALAELSARYLEAARGGTPLVAYAYGPPNARVGRRWESSQAGSYLHGQRRFLPMGPNVREAGRRSGDDGIGLVATTYDAARRRVLIVSAGGNDAEGGAPLERVRIRVLDAPLATTVVDQRIGRQMFAVDAALVEDGSVVVFRDEGPGPTLEATARGIAVTRRALGVPYLSLQQASWFLETVAPEVRYVAGELRTPSARIPVGRAHRRFATHRVVVDEAAKVAYVVSGTYGDCEAPDRHVIDRVDLQAATAIELAAGEGEPQVAIGTDGAFYLQVREVVRRYASSSATTFETLRSGLGLTSLPIHGNPGC